MTRKDLEDAIRGVSWRAKVVIELNHVTVFVPARRRLALRTLIEERMPLTVKLSVKDLPKPLSMKKRTYAFSDMT
ncbi:hypothetical protein [Citrobacter koseri]|uniref:hypothetical protein n=1 Tax=Citrobacter koseri TaxID=545 RepID=UPI000D8756EE|nr:hypothetical protein [Citrobacter koseri]SQB45551.1 Uncharacterised protein [Citrobacter koseri]